jgi:hypothetical protein
MKSKILLICLSLALAGCSKERADSRKEYRDSIAALAANAKSGDLSEFRVIFNNTQARFLSNKRHLEDVATLNTELQRTADACLKIWNYKKEVGNVLPCQGSITNAMTEIEPSNADLIYVMNGLPNNYEARSESKTFSAQSYILTALSRTQLKSVEILEKLQTD